MGILSGFMDWLARDGSAAPAELTGVQPLPPAPPPMSDAFRALLAAGLRAGDLMLLQASDAFALLPVRSGAVLGTGVTLDGAITPLKLARTAAQRFSTRQVATAVVRSLALAPLAACTPYSDADYANGAIWVDAPAADLGACCDACTAQAGCVAGVLFQGTCYMKNASMVALPSWSSGTDAVWVAGQTPVLPPTGGAQSDAPARPPHPGARAPRAA